VVGSNRIAAWLMIRPGQKLWIELFEAPSRAAVEEGWISSSVVLQIVV
jgi:hypothetical protein